MEEPPAAAPEVEIPTDWKTLHWPELRQLAGALTGDAVFGLDEVRSIIEGEVARRAATKHHASAGGPT